MTLKHHSIKNLEELARRIRIETLKSVYEAGSGHIGGSFSAAEILSVLYFKQLLVNPEESNWPDRDRFILSKGHAAPALYAALGLRGFFPLEDLKTLRKCESLLSGHPACYKTPGIDMTSGSLGHGLSAAVGMCIAARIRSSGYRTFVLMGDGEIQEGQVWEAAMSAAHFKIKRLIAIVDYNRVQLDGTVGEIMEVEPIVDKWKAFGWIVLSADGHGVRNLTDTFEEAVEKSEAGPVVIIARTIKGKGVSFMENNSDWHGKVPSESEYTRAMAELMKHPEVGP